ncbi:MAG: MATE family efflux transporter, partial [Actinomycetaceae bacterium]|nr:MATE family efflux transporter [Actinomycetaceae bacterium]
FDMGVAGSGLGTAIAQTLMAIMLAAVVLRSARQYRVSIRPSFGALMHATATGFPLLIRTVTLRIALLATVAAVTSIGAVALAAHQVVNTIWNFAAFALDALAIAAQALIGHSLGQGNPAYTHQLLKRIVLWGLGAGAVMGTVIVAGSPVLPAIFGTDPTMRHIATMGLVVAGVFQVLAGFVFMLDGVLIGAGDNRFLAWAGILTIIPYLPVLWWITRSYADSDIAAQGWGLVWVWFAFAAVFMGMRAITTGIRARGTAWMGLDNQSEARGENAGESPRHR